MFRPLLPMLVAVVACAPAPEGTDPDPTGTPSPTSSTPTSSPDPDPTDPDPTSVGDEAFAAIELFQAVAVPLMDDGAPIHWADRPPVVADRDAVLRARVDAGDGLVSVDLGGETFSAPVEDGVAVVAIPADAVQLDVDYVVRLDVDGAPAGRFPADGAAELGAIETGPLEVRLVPFDVNGFVPDTSPAVLEGYRQALLATYPVTDVTLTVADVEPWTEPFDIGEVNSRVGVLQEQAWVAGAVSPTTYFYGMVTGVATRDAFEGATGTSENGGPDPQEVIRAMYATGAAFGDQKSEDTLIHEIGHTHRLDHTACDGEEDTDPNYPYAGGSIGVEGYDRRTGAFLSPEDHFDLMSYCFPRWVSDYSWAKLAEHVVVAQDFRAFE